MIDDDDEGSLTDLESTDMEKLAQEVDEVDTSAGEAKKDLRARLMGGDDRMALPTIEVRTE